MGEMRVVQAVIDRDRSPDWASARRYIETAEPPELASAVAESAEPVLPVEDIRAQLLVDLALVEDAVAQSSGGELIDTVVRDAQVYLAALPSVGDPRTGLFAAIDRLAHAGVLPAAGFDAR